ncbi:dopa decarboxylase-like protein [Hortaea werneckii]|nr:dopa decarboxylase-like protein [Hortaea werneckii]KAI7304325.1 dopa decarboxylase-like protein [Hortaea werneckii]
MAPNTTDGISNGDSPHPSIPPMGMTGQQFRDAAVSVVNDIEQYYTNLPSRPVVSSVSPGYMQKLLPTEPPVQGESWQAIENDIERTIMPGVTHWQSPKFMAFFPASSTYPGILGEMWSAALTTPAFNWICSPAVTELETIVLDWLAQILGLPEAFMSKQEGGGVIQGSASEAIVTVMVAARERFVRRQLEREGITDEETVEDRSCELRSKLVALGSEQAHSSTKKAAIIAGTRYRGITTERSNDFALTGDQLRAKIEELHAKGLHPYYLTVTIGTTNTCAVDDFESIAQVAKDYPDIWIHCDAAYAGAALVLPEYHALARHMALVDSFDTNMHKWLLTNFDASCLFVQKRRDLTDALSITPAYLRNQFSDSGLVTDYRDWQIPLGRRFRSLKIWFVIRTWGVEGLRQHIRSHLRLGETFANLVRSRSDLFTILVQPRFALTVLAVNPRRKQHHQAGDDEENSHTTGTDPRPYELQHLPLGASDPSSQEIEQANEITKEVYTAIDARKEFFLTASVVGDTYAIRVVSANPLAEEKYLREVFGQLVEEAEKAFRRRGM